MKNSFFFSDYTGADQPLSGSVASNTDVWMDPDLSFLGIPDVVAKFQAANWQVRLQTCLVILQRQRAIDQFIAVANTLDEAKIPWWIHIEQAFGHGGEVATAASYTATPKDGVRALPDWNYGTGILGKAVSGVAGQATPTQFYTAYGEYPALWWNTPIEEYENRFGGALDQLIGQGWTNLVGFSWEEGYDNGIQWLSDRAHSAGLIVQQLCSADQCNLNPANYTYSNTPGTYFANAANPLDRYTGFSDWSKNNAPLSDSNSETVYPRLHNVDKVQFEMYFDFQYQPIISTQSWWASSSNWGKPVDITTGWISSTVNGLGVTCQYWLDVTSPVSGVCSNSAQRTAIATRFPSIVTTYGANNIGYFELNHMGAEPIGFGYDTDISFAEYLIDTTPIFITNIAYTV